MTAQPWIEPRSRFALTAVCGQCNGRGVVKTGYGFSAALQRCNQCDGNGRFRFADRRSAPPSPRPLEAAADDPPKTVPAPPPHWSDRYRFGELKPGGRGVIVGIEPGATLGAMQKRVVALMHSRHPGWRFKTSTTGDILRVWRVR